MWNTQAGLEVINLWGNSVRMNPLNNTWFHLIQLNAPQKQDSSVNHVHQVTGTEAIDTIFNLISKMIYMTLMLEDTVAGSYAIKPLNGLNWPLPWYDEIPCLITCLVMVQATMFQHSDGSRWNRLVMNVYISVLTFPGLGLWGRVSVTPI